MQNYIDFIFSLWEERRWGCLALTILLTIGCLFITTVLSVHIFTAFSNFMDRNIDTIMSAFSICFVVGALIWYKREEWREKHSEQEKLEAAAAAEAQAQEMEIAKRIAQNNYFIIRQCLFNVLYEKANAIGLEKPTSLSELDSPAKLIPRNGYVLCQYIGMKQADIVDTALISEYLQTKITQRLNAGEFPEVPTRSYIYEGQAHPSIFIDSITDAGAYIQINTVLVNEAYCQYLQNRQFARLESQSMKNPPKDRDF